VGNAEFRGVVLCVAKGFFIKVIHRLKLRVCP
jgi:hypothetical protein